jgi:conjugal transfer/type IV secretion protein DotA/TraY
VSTMKTRTKCASSLLAFLWLAATSTAVMAQTTTESIASITSAANVGSDKSMSVLQLVFGSIAANPLSSSSSSSSTTSGIAQVFTVMNCCILGVGALWAMYHFVSGLIATGAEGEFMGQKKSSPWYVVRTSIGFMLLTPIAGGYSGAQVLMLWATMMGVGIGNLGVTAATSALSSGGSMVSTPTAPQVTTLAKSLFEANLCASAQNQAVTDLPSQAAVTADAGETFNPSTATGKIVLMNSNGLSCGGAQINTNSASSSTSSSLSSTTGLVSYAPDTSSVTSSLVSAQQSALTAMQSTLSSAAKAYVTAVDGGNQPIDPQTTINQAAQTYQASIQSAISSASSSISSLSSTLQSNLTSDGWIMLGAWYQTFAIANSQLSSLAATVATAVPPTAPDNLPYPELYQSVMATYTQQLEQDASTAVPSTSTTSSGTSTVVSNLFSGSADPQGILGGLFNGQALVNDAISITSSGGQSGTSGTTALNPLIGMKNLGDDILDAGWGALAGYAAIKGFEGATQTTLGKVVSTALNIGTGGLSGAATGALKGIVDAIGPLVLLLVIALFFFGVMLSVYLPMLPFIIWFGGITAWFGTVCEAVVASPLWAFSHLEGDGEGMGQRTAHGYVFLLNLMFRPVFMVLGFLLAGTGIVALGTLLNTMFGVAMQNAQYNSVTGIVSILAYIVLYVGMCQTLCSSLFSLIHVIPDQAFAWVGGQIAARVGGDMHDKTHGVFVGAVGHGRNAATPMARGGGQPKPAGQEKPLAPEGDI